MKKRRRPARGARQTPEATSRASSAYRSVPAEPAPPALDAAGGGGPAGGTGAGEPPGVVRTATLAARRAAAGWATAPTGDLKTGGSHPAAAGAPVPIGRPAAAIVPASGAASPTMPGR